MIEVRKAVSADVEVIANFQLSMARETENLQLDRSVLSQGIRTLLKDKQKGQYYLALVNDIPVGSLMITFEWSDWRNGNVWWIQSVYVEKKYRGKGLFRKMYNSIKAEVENAHEVCGIRLYVFKDNHHAKSVYNMIGMTGDHYEVYEWMK